MRISDWSSDVCSSDLNASAMTLFNVRIPGLPMTVVQADGHNVRPVETDEFQITVAETYDLIVTPPADRAYTFVAEEIGRAPCRERVCQYVLISVVAVHLKKKNNKTQS